MKSREKKPNSREKIISLLWAHPEYSAKKLSEEIGVTEKAIERVGPDKGGSWEVIGDYSNPQ